MERPIPKLMAYSIRYALNVPIDASEALLFFHSDRQGMLLLEQIRRVRALNPEIQNEPHVG